MESQNQRKQFCVCGQTGAIMSLELEMVATILTVAHILSTMDKTWADIAERLEGSAACYRDIPPPNVLYFCWPAVV